MSDTGVSGVVKEHYARKDSLTLVGDCLVFGNRVVVPGELRERVLAQLHAGRLGISYTEESSPCYIGTID